MTKYMLSSINQHQQLQLLLPWYVNESLGEVERLKVEGHIHGCLLCNRELVALRKLQAAVNQASILQMAAEVSFASVCEKMQQMRSDSVCLIPSSQEPALNCMGRSVNTRVGFIDKTVKRPRRLLRLSDTLCDSGVDTSSVRCANYANKSIAYYRRILYAFCRQA